MYNTVITHAQLFGIGFSFGIAGPCLVSCSPALLAYIAGTRKVWREALKDIFAFLSGRLLAHLALGYMAGLSGGLLRRFAPSQVSTIFSPAAGILSLILAAIVLMRKTHTGCGCREKTHKAYDLGGLLVFGFIIGICPCGPFLALLLNIGLMSKSGLDGMSYAFSFGMGTFVSGLIAVGALAGVITRLPPRFFKSRPSDLILRIFCAGLLVLLGLRLIITPIK